MIRLSVDEMNSIIKAATGFAKKTTRDFTEYIHIEVENNVLYAVSCEGAKLSIFRLNVEMEDCVLHVPVMKKFAKADVFVELEETETQIIVRTIQGENHLPKFKGSYPDWRKFFPKQEVKCTAYFSAKHLEQAMKAVCEGSDKDAVRIDFIGDMQGVIIQNDRQKMLVLPINPKSVRNATQW